MKLIIDIPIFAYEQIIEMGKRGKLFNLLEAVAEGTPLQKGHGDLIDRKALRNEVNSWGNNDYEASDFVDCIDNAPTIIEADTEGEE